MRLNLSRIAGRLWCLAIFVLCQVSAIADELPRESAESYLAQLDTLRQRWQRAAELVEQGNVPAARQLLDEPLPESLDRKWLRSHTERKSYLRSEWTTADARRKDAGFANWVFRMEHPVLAAKSYEAARLAGVELNFEQTFQISQCYAEGGNYQKAKDELLGLSKQNNASDWKSIIEKRIALLDGVIAQGAPDIAFFRAYYLEVGGRYPDRVGPILALHRLAPPAVPETEKVQLMSALFAKMFQNSGDAMVKKLLLLDTLANPQMGAENRATLLMELGGMAVAAKNYDEAASYWQHVATDFNGTSAWPTAMFNLGMAHKKKAAYAQAITIFEKLRDSQVNDREPGRSIMETWRNYRPLAQWEIGNSLLEQGNHAAALAAYRLMREKYPFQSWCGNALADWTHRYALQEGLTLEHLQRYDEAVNAYLRAASIGLVTDPRASVRLVDLYEAAGQTNDLVAILEQWDRRFAEKAGANIIPEEYRPTRRLRRLVQLHQMERARDWPGLVSLLKIRGSGMGPEEASERLANYEAVEAARLLALHPAEAVPLLVQRITTLKTPPHPQAADAKWVIYALGLCGTPEAAAVLQRYTAAESNLWELRTLIYSLSLAGEAGQTALKELAQTARRGNFQSVMAALAAGELGRDPQEIKFPPLPPGTKLPGAQEVTVAFSM